MNSNGCLGLKIKDNFKENAFVATPSIIETDKEGRIFEGIVDIGCGFYHCLAITLDSKLYSWGNGEGGRLGNGDTWGFSQPLEIWEMRLQINSVYCGDSHSALIT